MGQGQARCHPPRDGGGDLGRAKGRCSAGMVCLGVLVQGGGASCYQPGDSSSSGEGGRGPSWWPGRSDRHLNRDEGAAVIILGGVGGGWEALFCWVVGCAGLLSFQRRCAVLIRLLFFIRLFANFHDILFVWAKYSDNFILFIYSFICLFPSLASGSSTQPASYTPKT